MIAGTSLGLAAGAAWGTAIHTLGTPSVPSLSVIGKQGMQIALLDTTKVRVLFLLGTPDSELREEIPGILTVLRQRIDIVVGSSDGVDALGAPFRERWRVRHTLVIPEGGSTVAPTVDSTGVTQDLNIDLGDGGSIDIQITSRGGWNRTATTHTLWVVALHSGQHKLTLAPTAESLAALVDGGSSLLILPDMRTGRSAAALQAHIIATNGRHDLTFPRESGRGAVLVRTYPHDVARFELHVDGIALPSWHESI